MSSIEKESKENESISYEDYSRYLSKTKQNSNIFNDQSVHRENLSIKTILQNDLIEERTRLLKILIKEQEKLSEEIERSNSMKRSTLIPRDSSLSLTRAIDEIKNQRKKSNQAKFGKIFK